METDPYIARVLARVRFQGTDARFHGAMSEAETLTNWLVILDELLHAARFSRDHPKGLRAFVVVNFLEKCSFPRVVECLHRELPRSANGRAAYEQAMRDIRRGRNEWRAYLQDLLEEAPSARITLGETLDGGVRQKLEALKARLLLEPAE